MDGGIWQRLMEACGSGRRFAAEDIEVAEVKDAPSIFIGRMMGDVATA